MADRTRCPDCEGLSTPSVTRRTFIQTVGATAAAASVASLPVTGLADAKSKDAPESLVKKLCESLTPEQKKEVCFDWNYADDRGLLRTHVSNNWNITDLEYNVGGKFFTQDQRDLIEAL